MNWATVIVNLKTHWDFNERLLDSAENKNEESESHRVYIIQVNKWLLKTLV